MKLIKCNHCGRPFYDNEEKCPYCGHDARLSANNFVTKPISDPKTHRIMEEVLSGNYHPEPRPVQKPVARPVEEPKAIEEVEPIVAEMPVMEPEPEFEPSAAVQERANAIAAIVSENEADATVTEAIENDIHQVETSEAPRKRHRWVWIVIILILLGIGAAVYLKWDFVYAKALGLMQSLGL